MMAWSICKHKEEETCFVYRDLWLAAGWRTKKNISTSSSLDLWNGWRSSWPQICFKIESLDAILRLWAVKFQVLLLGGELCSASVTAPSLHILSQRWRLLRENPNCHWLGNPYCKYPKPGVVAEHWIEQSSLTTQYGMWHPKSGQ